MARQPLLKRYPNAGIEFGAGFLEQRPKAAALIAECIAGWTEVELQTARMLAKMLHANTEPAVALYLSLANERAKSDALNAIADHVFDASDRALYDAIIKAKASVAIQRNALAHGLFGIVSDEAEGVGWINTKDRIKHMLEMEKIADRPRDAADFLKLKEFVSVYTIADLEALLSEIASMHRIIYHFVAYLDRKRSGADPKEAYERISNEELVRRFLPVK